MRRSIAGYGTIDFGITLDDYRKDADKQFLDWLATNDIRIIPVGEEVYFTQIVNDAIEKKSPFEGKEKQSDKGFKDVLIFYSMMSYAKKNKGRIPGKHDGIYYGNSTPGRYGKAGRSCK